MDSAHFELKFDFLCVLKADRLAHVILDESRRSRHTGTVDGPLPVQPNTAPALEKGLGENRRGVGLKVDTP